MSSGLRSSITPIIKCPSLKQAERCRSNPVHKYSLTLRKYRQWYADAMKLKILTPGINAPIKILPTLSNLNPPWIAFLGSISLTPFFAFSAFLFSLASILSLAASLVHHFALSAFARVIRPSAIGSVMVASGWDSEVMVRKASESRIVGVWQASRRTMVDMAKTGICATAGTTIVGRVVHLYLRNTSLLFTSICKRGKEGPLAGIQAWTTKAETGQDWGEHRTAFRTRSFNVLFISSLVPVILSARACAKTCLTTSGCTAFSSGTASSSIRTVRFLA